MSFSNTAVDATMTVVQHNDFTIPFTNTGNGGGTQTIRFSTDGTATGDLGIEQYFLGADGTNTNNFTVGIIGQNDGPGRQRHGGQPSSAASRAC